MNTSDRILIAADGHAYTLAELRAELAWWYAESADAGSDWRAREIARRNIAELETLLAPYPAPRGYMVGLLLSGERIA